MVKLIKGENDLATLYPSLVQEWHPTENGDLKPEDVSSGSSKEVWWLCPKRTPLSEGNQSEEQKRVWLPILLRA